MTAVEQPSPYYSALWAYKTSEPRQIPFLASIVTLFTRANATNITRMLGGPPDLVAIVPSKRGVPFKDQPLRRVVDLVIGLRELLQQVAIYKAGEPFRRNKYMPETFAVVDGAVSGRRVLLIEDTIASGVTAISVAGALRPRGPPRCQPQ